jgi:polysaccharide chain length determinant protein (PEP-CTERM system associated)
VLPGKVYTPEAVLQTVWRHKWLVVIPLALASAGVAWYSSRLPNLYRSETLIMVVPQRIPDTYVRSTVTSRIEDRLRSISEQIMSRSRLEQVIVELGLYGTQRSRLPMEEVVELMRREIVVAPVRGDMFRIAFVAGDPEVPARVVTRLAEMFIEENQRDRTVIAEDTNQFLGSQLAEAKARLVDHERKLEAYRLKHAGELPSQFESNLQMLQATQVQLQALTESINRDRDRRLMLETALADAERGTMSATDPPIGSAPPQAGTTLESKLETALSELRELESRLTTQHPDVVVKRREVEELEARLGTREGPSPPADFDPGRATAQRNRLRQVTAEIERLDEQLRKKEQDEARLNGVIAEYRRKVEAVPSRETEMTDLMRDYETLQRTYTSLLAKEQDSTIAANLERRQIGEQFKVIDPARVAERPFSPNRLRMNLIGVLAGLLLGFGLVALVEYRDTSFRTEDDVLQVLALPVLAVIPFMESPQEQRRRHLKIILTSVAGVVALGLTAMILALNVDLLEWFRQ